MRARGLLELGGDVQLEIEAPTEPGEIHVIFATTVGKVPGIPTCGGRLPGNPGSPWIDLIQAPNTINFIGVLDGSGQSQGIEMVGFGPGLLAFDLFMDITWVKVELPLKGCFFKRIGGTTHVYVGD